MASCLANAAMGFVDSRSSSGHRSSAVLCRDRWQTVLTTAIFLAAPSSAFAGMPALTFTDIATQRLEAISFFFGSLPAAATFDEHGRPLHSWQTRLLPFVEQPALYNRINRSLAWDDVENQWPFIQRVPAYMHTKIVLEPDEHGYARSGYAGNAYVLGGTKSWPLVEITDGASKTILCGEAVTAPRPWGDPINWRDPAVGVGERPDSFGGAFNGVTQFVFADGHTAELSNKTDPGVFRALCTPAGGDAVPDNDD
jgi:hypothetical protein